MMKKSALRAGLCAATIVASIANAPVQGHHAFTGYEQNKLLVLTGSVIRLYPDANHVVMIFAPLNDTHTNVQRDAWGQPVAWQMEFAEGAALAARGGITVDAFEPRTIFSVALRPLRNGELKGSREGPIFRCPARTLPKPGKHCDSVEGSTKFGEGALPRPVP